MSASQSLSPVLELRGEAWILSDFRSYSA
ncbi:conserved protein of unknown function (plasmid) [Xenorhabdus nematophila AN6/1]|nr:conserved protein of unknown function [Xenorhabdus nematophila AN6/1]